MRKLLLAAAATAVGVVSLSGGAAQAQEAEGFQLRIGGFYNALAIVRDQDRTAGGDRIRRYDFNQRGRWRIQGSQSLDNGMTVGFDTQYEMQDGMNNNRSYVYARGGFGNVQFGTMYSAPYLLHVSPPTAGWGLDDTGHSHGFTSINGLGFPAAMPFYINRSMNITYVTPRFAGLQAGVTFAPDQRNSPNMNNRVATNLSEQNRTGGRNRFRDVQNLVGAGLNYQQAFEELSLRLSAGLETGEWNQGAKNRIGTAGLNDKRLWTWSLAGTVGYAGLEFGAAYNFDNTGLDGSRLHQTVAGVTYTLDGFTFGPSFGWVRERGGNSDRRQLYIYEFGTRYALAPGVNLVGSVEHARYMAGTLGSSAKGNGTAGLFGVQMSF